jgi:hypothetical protein
LHSPDEISINKVISSLKNNSEVIHIIKSIGTWELEAEIESENIERIFNYIKSLKNELKETIKDMELVSINKELKLDFLPQEEFFRTD